jgi:hypothetical protein
MTLVKLHIQSQVQQLLIELSNLGIVISAEK